MVLGLLDPDLDPLVRCMDPDPDPSIIKQKKTLIPTVCDFFLTLYLGKMMQMYLHKVISRKKIFT
jgi:hypothetical protein